MFSYAWAIYRICWQSTNSFHWIKEWCWGIICIEEELSKLYCEFPFLPLVVFELEFSFLHIWMNAHYMFVQWIGFNAIMFSCLHDMWISNYMKKNSLIGNYKWIIYEKQSIIKHTTHNIKVETKKKKKTFVSGSI